MDFNYLDIIVIIILLVCIIEGLVRGFIMMVFSIASFIASCIIARYTFPIATTFLAKNTQIDESINNNIMSKISSLNQNTMPVLKILNVDSSGIINTITLLTLSVISFITIFIIIRVILIIISNILNSVSKLPVINQFNKVGGIMIGLIKGVLVLFLVFALLTPIIPLINGNSELLSNINNSKIAIYFYKHNIFISWINSAIKNISII